MQRPRPPETADSAEMMRFVREDIKHCMYQFGMKLFQLVSSSVIRIRSVFAGAGRTIREALGSAASGVGTMVSSATSGVGRIIDSIKTAATHYLLPMFSRVARAMKGRRYHSQKGDLVNHAQQNNRPIMYKMGFSIGMRTVASPHYNKI